ncbi:ABC transporter permease [Anaerocolumna sp.]|uniref:ABC transporter permease n=1 Tax=Anaerocolumna sp. TaxID=2041569 RepID=UPI0028A5C329|nr:ABC transporter permease [Anaerocolumna sp.]
MKKLTSQTKNEIIQILSAVVIALLITLLVLFATSEEPLYAFTRLITAPITKLRYFGNVLELMVPLAFAGLSASLLFRSGLFNMGGEGIFYMSGIVATVLATRPMGGNIVHSAIVILAASVVGGLIACISGFFKAKYDASELVTSLMLNTILFGIGFYILKTRLKDMEVTGVASKEFLETAKLTQIIPKTGVTTGFIILIIVTVIIWFISNKTKLGYTIKITGINKDFAKYSGMSFFALTIIVHFMSGFIAGMGSSIHLLSMYDRFTWSSLPGYGFDGCLVAMLGKNRPLGAIVAAFGLSYLRTGSNIMARSTDVPVEMVAIVEMILVLLITADFIINYLKRKKAMAGGTVNE